MSPTVVAQQQLIAQSIVCSVQGMDAAMKRADPADVVVNDSITEKYRQGIPGFVKETIPYCACLFRKANVKTRSLTGDGKTITQCGLPPRLSDGREEN